MVQAQLLAAGTPIGTLLDLTGVCHRYGTVTAPDGADSGGRIGSDGGGKSPRW
ncbi:hypothetical protein [Paenirhodobacter sp.]|uniref:hypothetical protein n=1 Tax=Paenirhodobacter sp. TaxID=1965326 RepID=UPI003B41EFD9